MKFETIKQHNHKKIIKFVFIVLTSVLIAFGYISQQTPNPLPISLKQKVIFKVIYPVSKQIKLDGTSYRYDFDQKVLTFSGSYNNHGLTFSEQVTPESLGSDSQPYYQAIGVHPYAQFKADIGQVALTKFWQSGTLLPAGQSGLLSTKGTFLTVHTSDSLSNQDWKYIFNSLKITK